MVILQFNKLIRNKWIWGAFAIAISAFFCLDDVLTPRRDSEDKSSKGEAGLLGGEAVKISDFNKISEEIRGFGRQRDWKRNQGEVNREAWEMLAALKIAETDGLIATDAEVMDVIRADRTFQDGNAFSFPLYQAILRENGLTPERFEEYLKRRLTLSRLAQSVLGAAAWTSPMELEQAIQDMTDKFTVKVAAFSAGAEDEVEPTEDDIKAWYDKNVENLALPERVKIRYVKYDATTDEILSKMVVTEEDMRDRYDVTIDRYTSTDTNGVETVKKFEEVKDELEKELRKIAAVQHYEKDLNFRAYGVKAAEGASRLDEIAREDGAVEETSDWFSTDGRFQEGFMKRSYQIIPGANGFNEAVAELDKESEDLRYAVVSSASAVWLIEKTEISPAHTPSFEEAKGVIVDRVKRDMKSDKFVARVEGIANGGKEALLALENVSTNISFVVSEMKSGDFADQNIVASTAMKLKAGEISPVKKIGTTRAVVVVCEERQEGDASKAEILRSRIRDDVAQLQLRQVPVEWKKWNLDALGFEAQESASTEVVEVEE